MCAGLCNNISVWTLTKKTKQWEHYTILPKYKHPPTSIALRSNAMTIAAIFPDNKIFEYNLEELKFNYSSMIETTNKEILRITFDPRNDDIILLYTDSSIEILNKKDETITSKKSKNSDAIGKVQLKSIKNYKVNS